MICPSPCVSICKLSSTVCVGERKHINVSFFSPRKLIAVSQTAQIPAASPTSRSKACPVNLSGTSEWGKLAAKTVTIARKNSHRLNWVTQIGIFSYNAKGVARHELNITPSVPPGARSLTHSPTRRRLGALKVTKHCFRGYLGVPNGLKHVLLRHTLKRNALVRHAVLYTSGEKGMPW